MLRNKTKVDFRITEQRLFRGLQPRNCGGHPITTSSINGASSPDNTGRRHRYSSSDHCQSNGGWSACSHYWRSLYTTFSCVGQQDRECNRLFQRRKPRHCNVPAHQSAVVFVRFVVHSGDLHWLVDIKCHVTSQHRFKYDKDSAGDGNVNQTNVGEGENKNASFTQNYSSPFACTCSLWFHEMLLTHSLLKVLQFPTMNCCAAESIYHQHDCESEFKLFNHRLVLFVQGRVAVKCESRFIYLPTSRSMHVWT